MDITSAPIVLYSGTPTAGFNYTDPLLVEDAFRLDVTLHITALGSNPYITVLLESCNDSAAEGWVDIHKICDRSELGSWNTPVSVGLGRYFRGNISSEDGETAITINVNKHVQT